MPNISWNVVVNFLTKVSTGPMKALENTMNKINYGTGATSKQMEVLNKYSDLTGMSTKDLSNELRKQNRVILDSGAVFDRTTGKVIDTGQAMKQAVMTGRGFRMELLSIMFGMMLLQRAMFGFMRAAITSYEKAYDKQSPFLKATNKLTAAFEFFKWSMIDALAQSSLFKTLVNWIFAIVNGINNFLAKHPDLKQWIPLVAIFIGIAAAIFGTLAALGLLLSGLKLFGVNTGLALVFGNIWKTLIYPAIMGVVTALGGIGPALLIIGAIIAIVVAMWISNFGGFRDFIKNTFGIIWEIIKAVFVALWKIVKTVLDIVVAIFKGDWEKVGQLTVELGRQLVSLFLKIMAGIAAVIINMGVFAWNSFIDLTFKIVLGGLAYLGKKMIELMGESIKGILRLFTNLPFVGDLAASALSKVDSAVKFVSKGFDSLGDKSKEWAEGLHASYWTAEQIKDTFKAIDRMMGLGLEGITVPKIPTPAAAAGGTINNLEFGDINIDVTAPGGMSAESLVKEISEKLTDEISRKISITGY